MSTGNLGIHWCSTRSIFIYHDEVQVHVLPLARGLLSQVSARASITALPLATATGTGFKYIRSIDGCALGTGDGKDAAKAVIERYIARCLFRKLSREISKEHCNGPFRLYCDDLRPDNILADSDLVVTRVLDWEFAYAAPVEFTYAAPWWLLLERPADWEPDLDEFLVRLVPRFCSFLDVLRDCGTRMIECGSLSESQRLLISMEKLFDLGLFWICLASRHSYMFDEIY
ncbi:uncharacterized protein NFIA_077440 [Aspergillus fischeri NRRL 181]|uniref:Aminoglycoside phosphotransferase domain-containing protein n=1 Tax=Neosartorya fischeri (strain ATCC 1020 / DSM 3700 / CBS 544.65 / FGSC A1164 / JCM 1740 / NRRL 181 / WB 181) TaxID=331117 RepID=A1DEK0_NEOFI|nr:uncharacterized protein NFIA_077440 [Aspergillus fischeri NRRL 181]EAW17807.1 hypothetical protein NFIA_077440 [Aspergillus fischeri NRRL 181]KAG2012654.1 hypothetical protein GB937_007003 [Aspergillus fischeri]